MYQHNFEQWGDLVKKFQEPLQSIAKLNVETLQSINYIKPEEFNTKKPEELFEKQFNLAMENGHKTLDYMQQSFIILEKAMLGLVKEAKKNVDDKIN